MQLWDALCLLMLLDQFIRLAPPLQHALQRLDEDDTFRPSAADPEDNEACSSSAALRHPDDDENNDSEAVPHHPGDISTSRSDSFATVGMF